MIFIIPGVNSSTPVYDFFIKEKLPFHICDIIKETPEEGYSLNKEMCQNFVEYFNPSLVIGKSYGSWIVAESIGENIPKILFSLPLKDKTRVLGFPKVLSNDSVLVYGKDDPYFSEDILVKNKKLFSKQYILPGDHSLRPVNERLLSDLRKIFVNEFGENGKMSNLFSNFSEKKKKAKVSILGNNPNYEILSLENILELLDSNLLPFFNKENGPITDIVMRKFGNSKIHCYQSNILDSSKINNLVKNCIATGGLGVSFSKKDAINKCAYEALERYSLANAYFDFITKTYDEIPEVYKIPKEDLKIHSQDQLNSFGILNPLSDKIRWTIMHRFVDEKEMFYPVSMITPSDMGEFIMETTSSGTAIGKTKEQSLFNGIMEIIERHSLMSWFYNSSKIKAKIIENLQLTGGSKQIADFLVSKGFKFYYFLIDFLGFPTIFIIANDGERVCFGSASHNINKAIEKSLYEIVITYFFSKTLEKITPQNKSEIKVLPQHMLYYQNQENFKQLISYLNHISKDNFSSIPQYPSFEECKQILLENGYDSYYKEITAPELMPYELSVTKVIIPRCLDIIKNHNLPRTNHPEIKYCIIPNFPTPFA